MSKRETTPTIQGSKEKPKKGHERASQKEVWYAPHGQFNTVEQVRKVIDPASLEGLVTALIVHDSDGGSSVDLIQPITAAVLNLEGASKYIEVVNDVWGSDDDSGSLLPVKVKGSDEDHFLIIVAGHRRHLAAGLAQKRCGKNPETLDIPFFVANQEEGPYAYRQAVKTQYRENNHKQLEPWEDALAISAVLGDARKQGEYSTYAECARELGITEERVSRAWLFQTLPDFVKKGVRRGDMSIGKALLLSKLYAVLAYSTCADSLAEEQKEKFLNDLRQNKLYLEEMWEHISEDDRSMLQDKFLGHYSKLVKEKGLRTKKQAEAYVENTIQDVLRDKYEQIAFIAYTEGQIIEEQRRAERLLDRKAAVEALRMISHLLLKDGVRAERGQQLAFAKTPTILQRLEGLREGLQDIVNSVENGSLTLEESAEAAAKIADELEASREDEMDLFSTERAAA